MAAAQRIYARALFEAAQERDRVTQVRDELGQLVDALEATPELARFLANPQVDPTAKAEVLEQVTEGAEPLMRNAVRLLASKGRAGELREVAAEYAAFVDQAEGRVQVELTTAQELSDDDAAAIVKRIEESSGRRVEATRSVDPSLVGGVILQAGSLRVDASIRGRLERLRRELSPTTGR
jgi:F-type H+-transporting ATPase subunit delta